MHDRLSVGLQIDDLSTASTDVMAMIRSGLVHIREQQRLEAEAPPEPVDRVERNVQIGRRRRARVPGAAPPPPPLPPPPPPPPPPPEFQSEPELDVFHETEVESEAEAGPSHTPSQTPSSQTFYIPGFERFASRYMPLSTLQEPSPFAQVGQSSHGAAESSFILSQQPEEGVTQAVPAPISPQHVRPVMTYERRQGDRRRKKPTRYTPSSS
jgi:hypothetical protein